MIENLTEAIAHAREVAEEQRKKAERNIIETTKEGWIRVYDGKEYNACLECAREHEQLAEWLTELKHRREADRWRPISEPPKEHDYYLVTCEFGVASATDIALFYPDRKVEEQWSLNYVTAWKPLPEPYESEENT